MKNKLDELDIHLKKLEKFLKNNSLRFIKIKRNDVEYGMNFPLFVTRFYDYIKENDEIPTQQQFYDYYINNTQNSKNIQKLDMEQLNGLRARLFRAYPSYIRDLHFALYLRENTEFDKVIYNLKLDTKEGIDVLVEENDQKYGICLYTDTRRANMAREGKIKRLNDEDVRYIELPLTFKGAKEIGDFFLYGQRELIDVFNIILKNQKAS